ncbi:MAG: bifunctional 4-hydroxy-2-oxoglutarate aldolase/2-dehydro-3-deoxy-phosphogluconate aldolase [Clostridiales bacterium]|jgi:2-dehydro-3-deoxyphosphogluconate aldolase/(4S)-4-hydroxy-2-oxoglutarate aldolase|nr:bifunctional 4-hydroxy-2-oxoglutarate aldolase/2-dehydro-3-deoxy-phosphogluconate aldolase [Clostridiales bacterium]
MNRQEIYSITEKQKLIAVLRGSEKEALTAAERLVSFGIKMLEVTFTVSGAPDVLSKLCKKYAGSDIIVGAGTVLDSETARAAMLCGAEFIVSPAASIDVIKICNRYSKAVFPGISSATELISVLEYGADFVKLFPGDISLLKALKAPFPNVKFMITGGVDTDNLEAWFKAGASACGAGSNLTAKSADVKKWIDKISVIKGGN